MKHALSQIQKGFDGIFDNMYNVEQKSTVEKMIFGFLNIVFKEVFGIWSRMFSIGSHASDHLQHVVVDKILQHGEFRDRMTEGIYIPKDINDQMGRLDHAMMMVQKSEVIERKVRDAVRKKTLARKKGPELFTDAQAKGVITPAEYALWKEAADLRYDAIQVDDFTQQEYHA